MRYLITGASGFLGTKLTELLISAIGNHVTVLKHNTGAFEKSVRVVSGNVIDYDSLVKAFQNIDIIIHCAAVINGSSKESYLKVNYQGTSNLLLAAREAKVKKFVYISSWSASALGGNYALSKFLAENEVKKYPNYLIVRPADIYSLKKSHLHNYIRTIKKLPFIPVFGKGNYKVSPVFIDDIVKIIIKIIDTQKNKTFTVTGPDVFTFVEFNKLIMKKLKLSKPIIHIPYYPAYIIVRLLDILRIPFFMNTEQFVRLTSEKNLPERSEKSFTRGFFPFESALKRFVGL